MSGWTLRTRLTVLYGGLFLLAGATLLALTYVLVQHGLTGRLENNIMIGGSAAGAGPPSLTYSSLGDQVRADALHTLLTQGTLALVVVGAVAIGLGWLIAERVLRPLHRITETARRVAGRGVALRSPCLHERIGLTGPRGEIKELADTFDSMLERLDRSFDSQRRFVANASHELRTPLAINRTLLEVALRRPGAPPQVHDLGANLLAVNARHERLIDGLLTLARSEQSITARDPIDLADIARHVADQNGTLVTSDLAPAPTEGDPILLERVAQNLVKNALDYNTADGWVSVTTATRDGRAELIVRNTGPVIPAYEIPGLFEPFRRLHDRVASDGGTGLGLSIVRSVAQAHGGDVTARPRPGGGLEVTVTLPRAGSPQT